MFFVSREGGWEFHPFYRAALDGNGQSGCTWPSVASVSCGFSTSGSCSISLSAVLFVSDFRFRHCICHFHCLDLDTLGDLQFMQQRPQHRLPIFRPLVPHRPLQSGSPACSYVLAGGGFAVLLQHNIFSFLYTPGVFSADIHQLGNTAPAIRIITGSWTQVDTPSVSSQRADND